MSVKVYKYAEDFGRMGSLTSVFIADEDTVSIIMGTCPSLGEVLGKHSDVTATISEDTVTAITDDPVIVEFFRAHLGGCVGVDIIAACREEGALHAEDQDE